MIPSQPEGGGRLEDGRGRVPAGDVALVSEVTPVSGSDAPPVVRRSVISVADMEEIVYG